MTLVYASERIDGVSGTYANPVFFKGVVKGAKRVYTLDKSIAEAYSANGVEVLPLPLPGVQKPKRKPRRKKEPEDGRE